jgi:hypothetical protein
MRSSEPPTGEKISTCNFNIEIRSTARFRRRLLISISLGRFDRKETS